MVNVKQVPALVDQVDLRIASDKLTISQLS